jgi:hypothetical protein
MQPKSNLFQSILGKHNIHTPFNHYKAISQKEKNCDGVICIEY